MQDLLYKMVERMLRESDSFSRNQHFEAFNDPHLRKATRIVRHLRALAADILAFAPEASSLEHRARGAGEAPWRLQISMEALGGHRVAYLSTRELKLLCLDPEVAARLHPPRSLQHLDAKASP